MKEIKLWKDLNREETYNVLVGSYNFDYNILVSITPSEPMETKSFYKGIMTGVIRYGIDSDMYSNQFLGDVLVDLQKSTYAHCWDEIPNSIKEAIKHNVKKYAERRKYGEAFSSEIAVLDLYDKYFK